MGQPIDTAFVEIRPDLDAFQGLESALDEQMRSLERSVQAATSQVERSFDDAASGAEQSLAGVADEAESAMSDVEGAFDEAASGAGQAMDGAADEATAALDEVADGAERSLGEVGDEAAKAGEEVAEQVESGADDAKKALDDVADEARKSAAKVGESFKDAGKKMTDVGQSLSLGLTAPIVGFGALALNASRDFNSAMANIATLIPGNTERVAELKLGVQDLAVEVGKSTADLSDGLYNVISAFGDSSESLELLDINARAATAGLATTQDAINLTSAVTKGYGDTSAEAVQKASDLALMTVRLGQTTFPELAASVGRVIPIANELNVSQEELFATMATFTGVTGNAGEVSTQLRGALQSLMAPTDSAAKAIEAAGFSSGKAAVDALGLEGALGILTAAAEESGQPLQQFIGQVEGQIVALGLAGSQADDYRSKLGEMDGALGATDTAFQEATQGVNAAGFQWEQAKARAEVLMQQVGDGLAPALISAADAAEPLINLVVDLADKFSNASPATQTTVIAVAGLVAAVGPLLIILGSVVRAIGTLIPVVASVGRGLRSMARAALTATRALGRFILATGRAVVALGRMIVSVTVAAARMLGSFVVATVQTTAALGRQAVALAAVAAGYVRIGVAAAAAAARTAAFATITAVIRTATAAWTAIQWLLNIALTANPIGIIIVAIAALIAIIVLIATKTDWFQRLWSAAWGAITAAATFAWENILKPTIDFIVAGFQFLWQGIQLYINLWLSILRAVADFFVSFWENWIKPAIDRGIEMFRRLQQTAARIFGAIVGFIRNRIAQIVAAANRIRDFVNRVRAFFGNAVSAVRSRISAAVRLVRGLPGRVVSALGNLGRRLWSAGRNLIQGFIDGIRSLFSGPADVVRSMVDNVRNLLPFSPAKEGPLAGPGSPELAGAQIAAMVAAGIQANIGQVSDAAHALAQAAAVGGDGAGMGDPFGRDALAAIAGAAPQPATGTPTTTITFAPGSIQITFTGTPSREEAEQTGQAVGEGIATALARRDVRTRIRTL